MPIEIYRAIADSMHPERRRARGDQPEIASRSELVWARASDHVRGLDDGTGKLEIVSILAKPHWTAHRTGIRFRDRMYTLTERETTGEGRQLTPVGRRSVPSLRV